MIQALLEWAWITSNLLVAAAVLGVIFFVMFYAFAFPWWQYPLGRASLAIGVALLGQVSKAFLGTFINPAVFQWWELPPGVDVWRVWYSLVVSIVVFGTVINVDRLLWVRRFRPELSPRLDPGAFDPRKKPSDASPPE